MAVEQGDARQAMEALNAEAGALHLSLRGAAVAPVDVAERQQLLLTNPRLAGQVQVTGTADGSVVVLA